MVRDKSPSEAASIHQIWIPASSNIGYAPYTIILESKSEIKVKVIQKWYIVYVTLHKPKIHTQTKFGIPTSNNIGFARKSQCGY